MLPPSLVPSYWLPPVGYLPLLYYAVLNALGTPPVYGAILMSGPVYKIGEGKYIYLWMTLTLNVSVTALTGEAFHSMPKLWDQDTHVGCIILQLPEFGGWPEKCERSPGAPCPASIILL